MSGTLSGQLTSLPPHLHPIALVSIVNMHYTTKNILAFWIDALAAMSIVTPSLVVLPSPTATTFGSSIAVVKGWGYGVHGCPCHSHPPLLESWSLGRSKPWLGPRRRKWSVRIHQCQAVEIVLHLPSSWPFEIPQRCGPGHLGNIEGVEVALNTASESPKPPKCVFHDWMHLPSHTSYSHPNSCA